MVLVLFAVIVGVTGWGFVRQPTGFLPTEDQGYAILVVQPARRRLPAPGHARSRTRSTRILEKTPGSPAG